MKQYYQKGFMMANGDTYIDLTIKKEGNNTKGTLEKPELNVLLAEDEYLIKSGIESGLSAVYNLNLHHVDSTEELKALIDKDSLAKFDIAVIDDSLDGESASNGQGHKTIKDILGVDEKLPVIAISGLDNEEKAKDYGAKEFVLKPYSKNHLLNLVHKLRRNTTKDRRMAIKEHLRV